MKQELASLLTTALTQYLDANGKARMCMSNGECAALEKAFSEDKFDEIEEFAQKKMTGARLSKFEEAIVHHCQVNEEMARAAAPNLLAVASKEFKDSVQQALLSEEYNSGYKHGFGNGKRCALQDSITWLDIQKLVAIADRLLATDRGIDSLIGEFQTEQSYYEEVLRQFKYGD